MIMTTEELKTLRDRLGLTQGELAEKLGVARNTITRWEMGIRHIPEPVARLVRLLTALPQTVRYLEEEEVRAKEQRKRERAKRRQTKA
jgi:transcriptional regulator with XRE-family HTH domain